MISRNHSAGAATQSIRGGRIPSILLRSGARSIGLLFSRQLITLDVKDGELRFVTFQRGRVVRWGMVALDSTGEDQGITASLLKGLVKELGLGGRWVVSLPLGAALVRRLALPRIKRDYLGQVIAAEVAESIPFPVEQVDLAWSIKKVQNGHQVVAIAVPKGRMDRMAAPLKASGLRLAAMYPRGTALACVAGTPKAVIVDLGVTSAGVVLVENGIPQVVHEVDLAGVRDGEAAAVVSQAVEQVATQFRDSEDSENSALPVLVTGNSGANGITSGEAERWLSRKVLALNPPLKLSGHFPVASYATNLGLFFAYGARPRLFRRASRDTIASVNVLPERHRPRPLPVLPVAVLLLIALFAYTVVGFQGDLGVAVSKRDALASRLVGLERQERLQRLERMQVEAERKRAAATEELADKLEARLGRMSQDMQSVMANLNLIYSESASMSVLLTGVSLGADGYSISGIAISQDNLIAYARRLRSSKAFQDVVITSIQSGAKASPGLEGESGEPGTGRVNFQLKASTSHAAAASK